MLNEIKKYWKEILFIILVIVAYYKIKIIVAAAKRKEADKFGLTFGERGTATRQIL